MNGPPILVLAAVQVLLPIFKIQAVRHPISKQTSTPILVPCNNSVQFTNNPIIYTCDSTWTFINPGGVDPDGDSLVYSLVSAMDDPFPGTAIPFNPPFTSASPLLVEPTTTFDFDSTTGQMTFLPQDNSPQVAVWALKVEEIRNGQVIATTFTEIMVVVLTNCQNSAPVLSSTSTQGSAIAINGNNMELCRSGFASFDLVFEDSGDSITATSNISTAIPGGSAIFTVNNTVLDSIIVTVDVNTTNLPAGIYPFSINVSDNSCPIPFVQMRAYNLVVYGASYQYQNYCIGGANPSPIIFGDTNGSFTEAASNPPGLVLDSLTGVIDLSSSALGTYDIIFTLDSIGLCTPDTMTVSIIASPNAGFNYPQTQYCGVGSTPAPSISGISGGSFSSTCIINPNSGIVDLDQSTPGQHMIYYHVIAGSCIGIDSFMIDILPAPNVDAGNNINICTGDSITLSASGAQSYQWDNGVTNGLTFLPASSQWYKVTGTDPNGCSNVDSLYVTISSNIPPTPDITATSNICEGNTLLLTTMTSAAAYHWSGPNGFTSSLPFPAFQATLADSGLYTLSITNVDGCTSADTSVYVTINALPTVQANTSNANPCPGDAITLFGTGSGNGPLTYSWSASVIDNVPFIPSSMTYTVTATDANNCINTDNILISVISIDSSVTLANDTLTANQSGATYQWIDCNGNSPIPGATGQSYAPPVNGTYAVEITMPPCVITTPCQLVVVNSNAPVPWVDQLQVFPNPTLGPVLIKQNTPQDMTIEVMDAIGKQLQYFQSSKPETRINLEDYPSGIYIIHLSSKEGNKAFKVIKKDGLIPRS